VISAPAVQFKGSGWYVTDYVKRPAASGSTAEGGPSATAEFSKADASEKKDGSSSKKADKPKTESKKPAKT
jgi:hypothetical protein